MKSLSDLVRDVRGMRQTGPSAGTVALIFLLAAAVYAFFAIADEVSEDEIAAIDSGILLAFRDPANLARPLGPAWLADTMGDITALGGYPVLVILVASIVGFLTIWGRHRSALFLLVAVITGTLVSQGLKILYDRPRPDLVDHLVSTHTASFPSGHATMSAVVYLTLAAMIIRLVDRRAIRAYVLCVAVALTVLVGVSRIYLGVHWPSDVAAGWALGAAWASLSWLAVSVIRSYRNRKGR